MWRGRDGRLVDSDVCWMLRHKKGAEGERAGTLASLGSEGPDHASAMARADRNQGMQRTNARNTVASFENPAVDR